jgi:pimeloyl-ACP methyl ester carboxylesterase
MRRALTALTVVAGMTMAGMTVGGDAAVAAGPSWSQLQHQFDYQRGPIQVTELGQSRQGDAIVHDITYRAAGQDPVSAYLVVPTASGRHPATLFLHWLDSAANANRSEFLPEAVSLASGSNPVVSLLPQLTFPFDYGPVGDVRDRDSVVKQVIQLRRGLDLLDARSDVLDNRVAVVGHDYGGMYASILDGIDRSRIHSAVVMAADSTMANWFVTFFLALPDDQVAPYTAMLSTVDPIAFISHGPSRMLLQYSRDDFFIPLSLARAMHRAAGRDADFRTYAVDHSLEVPAAQRDRDAFLHRTLQP